MWPWAVAFDWGGWRRRVLELRPGKSSNKLRSRAVWRVERAGDSRLAWEKATCWGAEAAKWAALARCSAAGRDSKPGGGRKLGTGTARAAYGVLGAAWGSGMCHRPEGRLVPLRIT